MQTHAVPSLLTPGRIAERLGVPLPRVVYVLSTRRHILPAARAGTLRLYDEAAIAQVRHELNGIDARRAGKAVAHAK
jgi:hypothetical protein